MEANSLEIFQKVAGLGLKAGNVSELVQETVQILGSSMYRQGFAIYLLDEDTGLLLPYSSSSAEETLGKAPVPVGEGIIGIVAEDGQQVRITDARETPDLFSTYPGKGSHLIVPIKTGDRVLGLMHCAHPGTAAFSEKDEHFLTTLAVQLSLAMERLRSESAGRNKTLQIDTLNQIGMTVSASLEPQEILDELLAEVSRMVGASVVSILTPENGVLVVNVVRGPDADLLKGKTLSPQEGLVGKAIETGQSIWTRGFLGEFELYTAWEGKTGFQVRSALTAPLMLKNRLVGVMEAVRVDQKGFEKDAVPLFEAAAAWAAVAVGETQENEHLQRRLQESQAIVDVNRALNEVLELERILSLIANSAQKIIPKAERAVIHLYEEDRRVLIPAAVSGLEELGEPNFAMRSGEGIAGHVVVSGELINLKDVNQDPRYLPLGKTMHMHSLLVSPIKRQDSCLGTISVTSTDADAFTEDDERLLTQLGLGAAIAIENARLFEVERKRRMEAVSLQQLMEINLEHERRTKEMEIARQTAEEASRAKSVFLANMSHELRTPLNGILGYVQLLKRETNLSDEQINQLDIIARSGDHLLELINSVLAISKIEAGQFPLNESNFDLYLLLTGLEEMFRFRAGEKGLSLFFDVASDVPQYIFADEGKVRQILINLLGNAIKFTRFGGVELRVKRLEAEDLYGFEVRDTGPGIPQEEQEVIFSPFVQAKGNEMGERGGTGLGLAISRHFAQMMGGNVVLQSEIGVGSIFCLEVKLTPADPVDVTSPDRYDQVIGLKPGQPEFKILVADDNREARQLLVKLLSSVGFDVQEASDGQEAIDVWESWNPDLIWMDMRMPVLDGLEATKRIKSTEQGQKTTIIALTANAFQEDREIITQAGSNDYLSKPSRIEDVFGKLEKHLHVKYQFQDKVGQESSGYGDSVISLISPAALLALPNNLITGLQQAITLGNTKQANTFIDQIQKHNRPVADAFRKLVRGYRFHEILELLEQVSITKKAILNDKIPS